MKKKASKKPHFSKIEKALWIELNKLIDETKEIIRDKKDSLNTTK